MRAQNAFHALLGASGQRSIHWQRAARASVAESRVYSARPKDALSSLEGKSRVDMHTDGYPALHVTGNGFHAVLGKFPRRVHLPVCCKTISVRSGRISGTTWCGPGGGAGQDHGSFRLVNHCIASVNLTIWLLTCGMSWNEWLCWASRVGGLAARLWGKVPTEVGAE